MVSHHCRSVNCSIHIIIFLKMLYHLITISVLLFPFTGGQPSPDLASVSLIEHFFGIFCKLNASPLQN